MLPSKDSAGNPHSDETEAKKEKLVLTISLSTEMREETARAKHNLHFKTSKPIYITRKSSNHNIHRYQIVCEKG